MKRIMAVCILLVISTTGATASAYTAEIAYYFQGLDVNTGTIFTDPMTFIILPVDEVEQILKPPADFLPQFDPAVDFFVEYDPAADITSLIFLPKAADDSERITAITIGEETFPIDFSGELVALNMPENPILLIFHTMDTQYEVELNTAYVFPKDFDKVPEPSTFLLFVSGMLALFGWRGRKKIRLPRRWLLFVFLMVGILVPEIALAGFCENVTEIPAIECEALTALYDSTNGDNWTNNSGWLQNPLVSQWHGITVKEGHVTGISLAVNELAGTIPPELGNLEKLVSLSLWRNTLSGAIPATLGNLQDLEYLILEENQLTGSIPEEIGHLTKLNRLFLCYNQLTGSIPASLGNLTNLEHFLLQYNQLSGEIPPELGNLTNVVAFRLDKNQLTGSIPAELGNLSPEKLVALFLAGNQLTGTIPAALGNLTSLKGLHLDNNQLSGTIPSTLGNLHKLTGLDLSYNQLEGNIPTEFGNLIHLEGLRLFENHLSGSIPSEFGNLSNLKECLLHSNKLTGEIPASLANLTKLDGFSSHYNFLEGCLPIELMPHTDPDTGEETGWLAIQSFSFHAMYDGKIVKEPSDPDFQAWLGTIPTLGRSNVPCETPFACENVTEIPQTECEALVALYNSTDGDNWTNTLNGERVWFQTNTPLSTPWYGIEYSDSGHVTTLSLGGNNLQGSLPTELAQLTELERLQLWENSLTGAIPAKLGSLSHLQEFSVSKNKLTGNIPSQLGSLVNLRNLDLAENIFTGVIPPELGNLSNLETLSLFKNQLTGNLPPEMGNLSNLQHFNAFGNQLNGELPSEFEKLENLVSLALNHNYFTGSIPPEWGEPEGGYLRSLQSLFLTANELSGSIPTELCNLTNLKELYVHDTALSGPLPKCLACVLPLNALTFGYTEICETPEVAACLDSWEIPPRVLGRTGIPCGAPVLTGWKLAGEAQDNTPTFACIPDQGVQLTNNTSRRVGSATWQPAWSPNGELSYVLEERQVDFTDKSPLGPWMASEYSYQTPYSFEGQDYPFSSSDSGTVYETRVNAFIDVNGNNRYDADVDELAGASNSCFIAYSEAYTWNSDCEDGLQTRVLTGTLVMPGESQTITFLSDLAEVILQATQPEVTFTSASGDPGEDLGCASCKEARFGAEAWITVHNASAYPVGVNRYEMFESGTSAFTTGMLPRGGIIFHWDSFFLDSQTEMLSIPTAQAVRDVDVTVVVDDFDDDGRQVFVEVRAGDVVLSKTYDNRDVADVLNETFTLPDVPGDVTQVQVTVQSPETNGDSVVLKGITVNVTCHNDYFIYKDPAHLGRFHDADKTGNNDSYKCHATASSNLLDWGVLKPAEFADEQQIFGYFQTNLSNKGSLVKYVGRCWIDGIMPPDFGDDWATASACPGYFSTGTAQSIFAGAYLSHWVQVSLLETIKSYLHSGYGVTISLYDSTDSLALGHVLSVWGYRYDAEGNVLGLWVTDSDDVSSEPPQEWLLPIEYSMGSGSEAKWRVTANSGTAYDGWLLEGTESLKPLDDTTPAAELPRLAIVSKKCVDNDTGVEIACPADDNVTVYIGDQVCDEECKRLTFSFDDNNALVLRVMIDFDPNDPVTFKGWEVNGEMWTGGIYTVAGDVYLRPVIGRCHHN